MPETLETLIGRRLVFGIPGKKIDDSVIRLFRETHAGGLILFRRNFESPAALIRLIHDLEEAVERRLLVMIDHEGGRVIHLPEAVTFFPDNLAAGFAADEGLVRKQGAIEARELARFGIHLNLAPCLDVLTERHSPNIGIRSYGRDPELVSRLGAARIEGLQSNGVAACAKHFPGQGQSTIDAHLGLPRLKESFEELAACHLKPFAAAVRTGVSAVMTSHPLYPNWEKKPNTPATFSRAIVTDYLRGELGFGGLILTDDMEMHSIVDNWPMKEAGIRAAEAGHDLLLSCAQSELQRKIFRGLLEAYRSKALPLKELELSLERILAFRKRYERSGTQEMPRAEPEGAALAEEIARGGLRIGDSHQGDSHRFQKVTGPTLILFPDLKPLGEKFALERAFESPEEFRKSFMKDLPPGCELQWLRFPGTGALPPEKVPVPGIIYFCWDAHLDEGCRKLLDLLQDRPERLTVVLLRNPYDAEFVRDGVRTMTCFGFRAAQIRAVFHRLFANR